MKNLFPQTQPNADPSKGAVVSNAGGAQVAIPQFEDRPYRLDEGAS